MTNHIYFSCTALAILACLLETTVGYRIMFGSCHNQNLPMSPMWERVLERDPQAWVWLGDNIYADHKMIPLLARKAATYEDIAEGYRKLNNNEQYAKVKARVPIFGTWDDHDVGKNDADTHYDLKEESKQLFFDFIGEPADSPRRQQPGVYSSHILHDGAHKVKLILLDNRYMRDPYGVTDTEDMLGPEQWRWLENELLSDQDVDLTLIGGGIQIVPSDRSISESWAHLPFSREKLLKLVAQSGRQRVLLLSGDIHMAEINRLNCSSIGYPLYEFTSSGMTHSWTNPVIKFFVNVSSAGYQRVYNWYSKKNIGEIDIDWEEESVTGYIWGEDSPSPIMTLKLKFNDIQRGTKIGPEDPSCQFPMALPLGPRVHFISGLSLMALLTFIVFCTPCILIYHTRKQMVTIMSLVLLLAFPVLVSHVISSSL